MIGVRHYGIYVRDINKMEQFYINVLQMSYICRQEICRGEEFDILAGVDDVRILMSKLITERGRETGSGDMIELLQIDEPKQENRLHVKKVTEQGTAHIGIECRFSEVLPLTEKYNGKIVMKPVTMKSGNRMCFISDPEGNYIELIERINKE